MKRLYFPRSCPPLGQLLTFSMNVFLINLFWFVKTHHLNTGTKADTVVGDSKYGTIENFLACHDRGVEAPMPDLRESTAKRIEKLNIFPEERFEYDRESDTFLCPAGNRLKLKSLPIHRLSRDYAAPKKICAACHLREQWTRNKSGRTIKRHLRQEELDGMREANRLAKAKRDIKMRQHLMERSFARGTRYGFDRARWGALAGADTGIPNFCSPEHRGFAQVWILPEEKSIGIDGADQRGCDKGYKVFFRFQGADELKNRPNGAIWFYLPSAIIHRNLNFQIFLDWAFEQQPVKG